MAIDSEGNLDVYKDNITGNTKEKYKSKENSPEYNQLERWFEELRSKSTNEVLGPTKDALWGMFYPVHEYFFWQGCKDIIPEHLREEKNRWGIFYKFMGEIEEIDWSLWNERKGFYIERARGDKKFCNKQIKSEKERENPLKNYHSKTIKEFIKNHNSEFDGYPLNTVLNLPERKFVQYGCKPTSPLSFIL